MVSIAKNKYQNLNFIQGDIEDKDVISSIDGPFDFIVLSDTIGYLNDCEEVLSSLHSHGTGSLSLPWERRLV